MSSTPRPLRMGSGNTSSFVVAVVFDDDNTCSRLPTKDGWQEGEEDEKAGIEDSFVSIRVERANTSL